VSSIALVLTSGLTTTIADPGFTPTAVSPLTSTIEGSRETNVSRGEVISLPRLFRAVTNWPSGSLCPTARVTGSSPASSWPTTGADCASAVVEESVPASRIAIAGPTLLGTQPIVT
jgi:hypothetical protein